MGNIHLNIDPEIEKKFRATAARKFGFRKGSLGMAMKEALEMWLANNPDLDEKL